MLVNKKAVKTFAMEAASRRAHQFSRVGNRFVLRCEAMLKDFIRSEVRRLPSKGKTIN